MKMFVSVLIKYIIGLVLVGVLLFLPAGSLDYWNAWVYIVALFVPIFIFFIVLFAVDKEFLQKRVNQKETEKKQKMFVRISTVLYLGIFIIPGLDYRFGWSSVSMWVVIASTIIMLFGYLFICIAMLQNRFASRIVELQENQKVISTGLYGIVRHPMYLGMIMLYIPTPLILGSLWGLIPAVFFAFSLSIRIINEEKVLESGLPGYIEYKQKVRYRLVPFIW